MSCDHFLDGDTFIHRLDPRTRVVTAFVFCIIIAVGPGPVIPLAGLALSVLLCLWARLPLKGVLRRLGEVNVFMAMLVVILPFSVPGTPLFSLGPIMYTREGLRQALLIAAKGNGIALMMTVMLTTMDVVRLGHALSMLKVPDKLIHLFLFTVRYVTVLEHEYRRLSMAMKVRCFQPRMNRHSYRSLAYLVAMLLVRSYYRSNRILAAMKCRGFHGRFYVIRNLALAGGDVAFSLGALVAAGILVWAGWA